MNPNLLKKLKNWRDATAKSEMTDFFRVLPNRTIEDIARMEPKTREELISIKGIKDKKYYKYGKEILDMVKDETAIEKNGELSSEASELSSLSCSSPRSLSKEKTYSVSEFLDYLNDKLICEEIRIRGEITTVDSREKVVYFNLKDKKDESVVNCLIFRYQYEVSGVALEIGDEIIINGYPEIYKPTGRLSVKASLIEIAGEGALKKAYEKLKNKLEKEGLFSSERKKPLPSLPEIIGLITSNQGAAIGDFTTNIGKYGFKIKFINSNVEGKQAVFDLIKAVKIFKKMKNIDVLAIIRGGGSLESLQAFNNETLVREISNLNIPVICGVGHEKDVSLVSLASDLAVSTPTAAARAIRESWDRAVQNLDRDQKIIAGSFEKRLYNSGYKIETAARAVSEGFEEIISRFDEAGKEIGRSFHKVSSSLNNNKKLVKTCWKKILFEYERIIATIKSKIKTVENEIKINNPERQLILGYSIVSFGGRVIRSVKQVKKGDTVGIKVSDGEIMSEIRDIELTDFYTDCPRILLRLDGGEKE